METRGSTSLEDDVKHLVEDYEFARDGRYERETLWSTYWKIYLTEERRKRRKNRSNTVGPHGGMTIRILVPAIKKNILSTRPFVRVNSRKVELGELAPLLDSVIDYWIDVARVKSIVLGHGLREGLIFGVSWHIADLVTTASSKLEAAAAVGADGNVNFSQEVVETLIDALPKVIHVPVEMGYPYPVARDWDELRTEGYFIRKFFKTKRELLDDGRYDQDEVEKIGTKITNVRTGIPLEQMFAERRRRVLGLTQEQWHTKAKMLRSREDEPVEVLEEIVDGKLIAVANRSIKIRDDRLRHPFPVFRQCPDPIPGEIFGKSVYHDVVKTLDARDFLLNNCYDNAANPVHAQYKGLATMFDKSALQSAGPGEVISVKRMDALEPLLQENTLHHTLPLITHLDRDIERGTGVSEIMSTIGAGAGTVYPETATVGSIKNENAFAFVSEMTENIEDETIRPMVRIFLDLAREVAGPEFFVRLAGEDGARWRDISPSTLADAIDFDIIGSAYAQHRRNQAMNLDRAFDRCLAVVPLDPGAVDLRKLLQVYLEVLDVPNRRAIVRGEPRDVGPEAEHQVMLTGIPVKPERDEDFAVHMQAHVQEIQRVMQEPGSAESGYVARLLEHVRWTQRMMQEISRQQELELLGAGGGSRNPLLQVAEQQSQQGRTAQQSAT